MSGPFEDRNSHSGEALIGRTRDVDRLAGLFGPGGPSCPAIHVSGEPGVGKTALIRAAVTASGLDFVWCNADRLGQERPLEALWRGLNLSGDPTPEAIAVQVGCRLDGGPLVLVIDDVHWCDDATFRFLPRLMEVLRDQDNALILVTAGHRPVGSEAWRLHSMLAGRCSPIDFEVTPLSQADSGALVARVVGHGDGRAFESCAVAAGGNPRLLIALAEKADAEALTGGVPAAVPLPLGRIPHLAHLATDTIRLLEVAAVLGDPFDAHQLAAQTGRSYPDVVRMLGSGIAVGVLDEALDGFRFRHPLTRHTLANEVPASVRSELHRRAARALTESDGDPQRTSDHLMAAELSLLDFEWVRSVADRCAIAAPDRVIPLWRHYAECAQFSGPRDDRKVEVDVQIAMALLSQGRALEAEAQARAVLDRSRKRDARVISVVGSALMLQGRYDEVRSFAGVASLSEELQPWERAEQGALAGSAALLSGDAAAAVTELEGAAHAAARAGSVVAQLRVLVARGHLAHLRGDLGAARTVLGQAAELCVEDDSRAAYETFAHALLGMALADGDDVVGADRAFQQGEDFGGSRGSLLAVRFTHLCRSFSDIDLGRLDRAVTRTESDLADPDDLAALWRSALLPRRALAALYCDGPDAAESWLRRLPERDWLASGHYGMAWRPRSIAAVRLARGDVDDAVAILWSAWQEVMAAGLLIETRLLATELVDASRRTKDVAKSWNVVEALEELASRNPDVASLAVQALTVRGMVTDDCDALMAATELTGGLSHRMVAARAAEEAAISLIASGRPESAREVSRQALDGYAGVGAAFEAARARAAFRRAGIRVRKSAIVRPRKGWEALTPAEQVVARYVERGLSNAEISDELVVSRRTVESHVSHILAKLGVRSRADLILAAAKPAEKVDS